MAKTEDHPPVPAVVIAGTHSGSGKTTVTLAVMAAMVRRGLKVQGFKVGPDFIDPGHHAGVTGRSGRNLDTWLMDLAALSRTYRAATAGADVAVIEGVMGLFDGRSGLDESGSTADLARAWGVPVVLVVDAKGAAKSVAAVALGFATFDPAVRVVGVVANQVGSHRHYAEYLAPGLRSRLPDVAPLGYLGRDDRLSIPSRHLGLLTSEEFSPGSRFRDALADAVEATLDLDRLLALARPPTLGGAGVAERVANPLSRSVRVALARDPAFCFYYEDNLDLLRAAGAEVVPFSPLDDPGLPDGTGLVYLGGGYPEVFAARLAANLGMREFRDASGQEHRLWGLIPAGVLMQARFAALGYVTVSTDVGTRLGPPGTRVRGHEFHYSTLEPFAPLPYATTLQRPDRPERPDAVQIGGLLAGYAHMHFGSNPGVADSLLG
ncbi:MAG: cobyrinate a,c-diamide synthase [Planctomycetia bacterium]|nr:cobyrinate a,c-diamide synthase [Planctomycetia bacterium]